MYKYLSSLSLIVSETGPWVKVSSERPEKRGIDLAIPGLVV